MSNRPFYLLYEISASRQPGEAIVYCEVAHLHLGAFARGNVTHVDDNTLHGRVRQPVGGVGHQKPPAGFRVVVLKLELERGRVTRLGS
ncbi:MAG: hypothetical protein Q8L40_04500, partial [Burkholderiales bacterium]|nr:hypothetical protein [Burkholderiales bacterium]